MLSSSKIVQHLIYYHIYILHKIQNFPTSKNTIKSKNRRHENRPGVYTVAGNRPYEIDDCDSKASDRQRRPCLRDSHRHPFTILRRQTFLQRLFRLHGVQRPSTLLPPPHRRSTNGADHHFLHR